MFELKMLVVILFAGFEQPMIASAESNKLMEKAACEATARAFVSAVVKSANDTIVRFDIAGYKVKIVGGCSFTEAPVS